MMIDLIKKVIADIMSGDRLRYFVRDRRINKR